jgi:hypothetical protein
MLWRRPESRSRQLRHLVNTCAQCGDLGEAGTPAWYARRSLLRAAVFDTRDHELWAHRPAVAASVITGVIAEVREGIVVLESRQGTEFVTVSPATVTWLGSRAAVSALRCGDQVVVRYRTTDAGPPVRRLAERIWARIGRVTGTIIAAQGEELLVDAGRHDRTPRQVLIAAASARQIQVRFPRLTPGYLLDVIGTWHGDHLLAVAPATAQPAYRAGQPPAPPLVSGPLSATVSGSAVWHEPDDEPADLLGLGYPALDPDTDAAAGGDSPACVRLPYLSLGSAVRVSNECAKRSAVLPVTSDGAMARQFCDRCVDCGTSPRGRVADLTMAAFVELGGNLEHGCFNATLTVAS